jgi:hypothetical protein
MYLTSPGDLLEAKRSGDENKTSRYDLICVIIMY